MPSVEGLGARRAALQMLDAVLRRGQTLDAAARLGSRTVAARPCAGCRHRRRGAAPLARPRRTDRRRDAQPPARRQQGADGAPPRACAEGRARHARARAGRDRAAAGRRRPAPARPWRARHPASAWRARDGCAAACRPRSRSAGELHGAMRPSRLRGARSRNRPALDLTFADDAEAQAYAAEPRRRLARAASCATAEQRRWPSCPASGGGRWWVQDLAASLPARLIPGDVKSTCSTCARRPAARRCSSPPPAIRSRPSIRRQSPRTAARESRAHPPRRRIWSPPMR